MDSNMRLILELGSRVFTGLYDENHENHEERLTTLWYRGVRATEYIYRKVK